MSGRPNPINIRKGSKANRVPANSKAVAYKRAKAYVMKYEAENTSSAKIIQKAIRAKKAKKEGKKMLETKKQNIKGDIVKFDRLGLIGKGMNVIKIKDKKDKIEEGYRYRKFDKNRDQNKKTVYEIPSGTIFVKIKTIKIKKKKAKLVITTK